MQFTQAILTSVTVLLLFDVLQDVLRTLHMKKLPAALALVGISLGGFFDIYIGNSGINVGGTMVPFLTATLLFIFSSWRTRGWSLFALAMTAAGGYLLNRFLPPTILGGLSSAYIVGFICGVLSVTLGKYRRSAIISGLLGTQGAYGFAALEELLRGGYAMVNSGMGMEYEAMAVALLVSTMLAYALEKIALARKQKKRLSYHLNTKV